MEKLFKNDYQMDISGNCTTENSNLVSLSNLEAENNFSEEKISNHSLSSEKEKEDRDSFVNQNTYRLNVNSRQQSSSAQKLTPVKNHPLEFGAAAEDDDEICGNSNVNFPDVVLMTHHQQQQQFNDTQILQQKPPPSLRLNQPPATSNMNSVNNNDGRNRVIPKYREPSPVS
jgi:hypothetical protein